MITTESSPLYIAGSQAQNGNRAQVANHDDYIDYDSDYETLLKISGTFTMQIKWIKQLAIEIFRTVNNLNPDFMKNLYQ